ncbi:hypothetical protein C8J56DRAFT_1101366 [Mycena floridula]|nr:hypothetical protein C8J56DRAFT_1101366 [Mycena floridula]
MISINVSFTFIIAAALNSALAAPTFHRPDARGPQTQRHHQVHNPSIHDPDARGPQSERLPKIHDPRKKCYNPRKNITGARLVSRKLALPKFHLPKIKLSHPTTKPAPKLTVPKAKKPHRTSSSSRTEKIGVAVDAAGVAVDAATGIAGAIKSRGLEARAVHAKSHSKPLHTAPKGPKRHAAPEKPPTSLIQPQES